MTSDILLYLIILLIIIISVYLLSHKWADAVKSYSSVAVSPLISFAILVLGDTWADGNGKVCSYIRWGHLQGSQGYLSCSLNMLNFYVLQHVFVKLLKNAVFP